MVDVYYIGGSPCSGKSTIAEMLVEEYGFAYYKLDDFLFSYMERAAKEGKPHSAADLALSPEETWMRPVPFQAEEEVAVYEELLVYAQEGIAGLGEKHPILAEGAGFMPRLMAGQKVGRGRYVCIVPTEAFQRENYAKRPWIGQYLEGCSNPDAAFDNWMQRDALFAKEMLRQADEHGYATIVVDGSRSIEENYEAVARVFGLEKQA